MLRGDVQGVAESVSSLLFAYPYMPELIKVVIYIATRFERSLMITVIIFFIIVNITHISMPSLHCAETLLHRVRTSIF